MGRAVVPLSGEKTPMKLKAKSKVMEEVDSWGFANSLPTSEAPDQLEESMGYYPPPPPASPIMVHKSMKNPTHETGPSEPGRTRARDRMERLNTLIHSQAKSRTERAATLFPMPESDDESSRKSSHSDEGSSPRSDS
eukprot:2874741-Rhodomonas_salina.2